MKTNLKKLQSVVRAISPFRPKSRNINTISTNSPVESKTLNNKINETISIADYYWNLEKVELSIAITAFYNDFNPSKVSQIAEILQEFQGEEMLLLQHLCERYELTQNDMQRYLNKGIKGFRPPSIKGEAKLDGSSGNITGGYSPRKSLANLIVKTQEDKKMALEEARRPSKEVSSSFLQGLSLKTYQSPKVPVNIAQGKSKTKVNVTDIEEVKKMKLELDMTRQQMLNYQTENKEMMLMVKSFMEQQKKQKESVSYTSTKVEKVIDTDTKEIELERKNIELMRISLERETIKKEKEELLEIMKFAASKPMYAGNIVESYLNSKAMGPRDDNRIKSERRFSVGPRAPDIAIAPISNQYKTYPNSDNENYNEPPAIEPPSSPHYAPQPQPLPQPQLQSHIPYEQSIPYQSNTTSFPVYSQIQQVKQPMVMQSQSLPQAPQYQNQSNQQYQQHQQHQSAFQFQPPQNHPPVNVTIRQQSQKDQSQYVPQPQATYQHNYPTRKPVSAIDSHYNPLPTRTHASILKDLLDTNENIRSHMQDTKSSLHRIVEPRTNSSSNRSGYISPGRLSNSVSIANTLSRAHNANRPSSRDSGTRSNTRSPSSSRSGSFSQTNTPDRFRYPSNSSISNRNRGQLDSQQASDSWIESDLAKQYEKSKGSYRAKYNKADPITTSSNRYQTNRQSRSVSPSYSISSYSSQATPNAPIPILRRGEHVDYDGRNFKKNVKIGRS